MNKKEVLFLSIGIFLTVTAWLIADVYHAATEEKIKTKINIPTLNNYKINTELLETLKNKQK
ncbi:hypothetical protein COY13_03285 [Candidatus Roizmanbacteria bacterium CG_4_10_14_0_2_um_filter_36_35]|uniref:Uncharacterized protein n=4 Tax=Candidatus Roizmaniibacteriota TaxID=1752723 RepID=A0A2M7BXF7_9BACT|nr:MAG: hypothetical protein COV86_01265 [Candidatus Roizmanbacteria bacterium CG11_big_fil_rev_8_21_14_0_20_35_14]PIV11254.1 MAG: hypothetical protein COS50_00980 [Candidatus Roizmanbacteria bacterium CG03_land_8_20_14_0_80_35_26]PIZ67433.1 MAG: hypothetical protein COY13_03285 [Candidatus Roizmanbacteria bacterium CG_4_10_14_0_2_um_filter_36_35]PJC32993.1 MAG: hypothetical protein CO049_01495 [Candidatus Roizmanbacteria bacterium CG_4_9_14_0_2_um_filter_36_12]PJC80605.1 MAG: hypothetical prot